MIVQVVMIAILVQLAHGTDEVNHPAVRLRDGCICGTTMPGLHGEHFEAFLGIPYAKPPVGKLRFANPVRNDPWEGTYDATKPKTMCIQKNDFAPRSAVQGSEDCLYLNVYRPKNISNLLPVMVFIHGGGFFTGSSHPAQYGPERIMNTRQVILVTLQYRLGVFGFLSTNDLAAPGNFGLKDQSLALRWVRRNIRRFSGDPDEVTLFGHGTGASCVQQHMMSPLSKGLFARAISMSGSALSGWNDPPEDPLSLARRQAAVAGVKYAQTLGTWELVKALQKVDAVQLTKSRDQLKGWNNFPIILYTPVVEQIHKGTFMSEDPREIWEERLYDSVPWMTGYLPNDGGVVALGLFLNHTIAKQFIELQKEVLPSLALKRSYDELLSRFFDGYPVQLDSADQLAQLATEANFLYPMLASIQQYQKHPYSTPVSFYKFNFKGRYSYQDLYAPKPSTIDLGILHGSELMYLFRMPAVFPDFEKNSPEEAMSKEFVRQFVHFAINGKLSLENLKPKPRKCKRVLNGLQIVEFTNSNQIECPIKVNSLNCCCEEFKYLLDVLSWWSKKV